MSQHWVFHYKEPAKIVSTEEYEMYLKNGWSDSPATVKNPELTKQESQEIKEEKRYSSK